MGHRRLGRAALGGKNVDDIVKFSVRDDTIELDRSVFRGLKAGDLDADAFVIARGAKDGEDRIVYDARSGALLFDADGKGGADAVRSRSSTGTCCSPRRISW